MNGDRRSSFLREREGTEGSIHSTFTLFTGHSTADENAAAMSAVSISPPSASTTIKHLHHRQIIFTQTNMFSSAARTFISRAAVSASSRGAVNRLSVQPSMMAARFGSVSFFNG